MPTIFTHSNDATAKKIARKYKVKPESVTSIYLEPDLVVIEYVEYHKDDEVAFCQKKIHRSAS